MKEEGLSKDFLQAQYATGIHSQQSQKHKTYLNYKYISQNLLEDTYAQTPKNINMYKQDFFLPGTEVQFKIRKSINIQFNMSI